MLEGPELVQTARIASSAGGREQHERGLSRSREKVSSRRREAEDCLWILDLVVVVVVVGGE